ncbi:MAG: nucleotidyltransferase family protein [Chloroflexales bacterium]|nr:nucleotidyltransferase family protein [Chloroflexales bacterium]
MSLIAGNLGVVQRLLDGQKLPWAVCAGAAAHLYGNRRPLQDIDLLVSTGKLGAVVGMLQQAQKAVQFDGQRILWRGIKVFDDLTVRRAGASHPYTLDATMLAHLRRMPLLGSNVAVLAPEDVLLHKLLLARGADEGKHDLDDVAGIVRRQQLDAAYLIERMQLMNAAGLREQLGGLGVQLPL